MRVAPALRDPVIGSTGVMPLTSYCCFVSRTTAPFTAVSGELYEPRRLAGLATPFRTPLPARSATQKPHFALVGKAKHDVRFLYFLVHATVKCVIRRFEETGEQRAARPLVVVTKIRFGPTMLHYDLCLHKFPSYRSDF